MPATHTCSRCSATTRTAWPSGICPACALEFGWLGYDPEPLGSAPPSAHAAPQPLGPFGDYQLLEEIGAGGMGVVYRALQISLNRVVALKRIRAEVLARDQDRQRFRTEAEAAAQLRHPNIVAIHDVGEHAGHPFYTMEFVQGTDLAHHVHDGPMPPERAARYLVAIAQAIHHAHQHGILHRDLKPSNLIIDAEDQPRVLDFGLAKIISQDSQLTRSHAVLGSPSYMSPEQAAGSTNQTDPRSDVYSLGAVLYELITGRAPFRAASPLETLRLVQETDPVPPRSLVPLIPSDLETICLKCLAKAPDRRYASADALALDLQRFLRRQPILARPVGPVTRSFLWARRRPLVASLAIALALAFLAGSTGIVVAWRLEHQQQIRALASERQARLNLYAVDMNLAQQAVEEGQIGRAREILATYAPSPHPAPRRSPSTNPLQDRSGSPIQGFAPFQPGSSTTPLADGTLFDPRGFEWRHLWHASRGDPHQALVGHDGLVSGLALSMDGSRIFSSGFDAVLRAQTLKGSVVSVVSNLHGLHPSSLALHPQRQWLALGGDHVHDGLLLDLANNREFRLPAGALGQVQFSPDGQWLLSGSLAGWITSTGSMAILNLEGAPVRLLPDAGGRSAFSPDGTIWATGASAGHIRLWAWPGTISDGIPNPTPVRNLGPVGSLMAMAFSPNGRRLATSNGAGALEVWDVESSQRLQSAVVSHDSRCLTLAYSPDGQFLATGSDDRQLRVWNAETLALHAVHRGHHSSVWALAWTPDGQSIVTGGADGSIRLWPNRPPPPREIVLNDTTANYHHSALAFSPDSRWLSTGMKGGRLGLWDTHSGQFTRAISVNADNLHAAFSADSSEIYVAVGYRDVTRYSVPNLEERERVPMEPGDGKPTVAGALSDDGRWLAGMGADPAAEGAIQLWNARTGQRVATLKGHSGRVQGLRFSSDNHWLASGSADQTARLWDLTTLKEAAVLRGAANAITMLSFAPDGHRLAAGGWDGVLRLWRIPEGDPIATIPHGDGTPIPEFLPDGRTLAVMVETTGVRLYNLEAQRDTGTLRWPNGRPYRYIRSSPNGEIIAAHSQDGHLKLWQAPPPESSL